MLQLFVHAWERRLASVTKDRVVRPFEWGLDWIPPNGHALAAAPPDVIGTWVSNVMTDTDAFFTPPPTEDYTLGLSANGEQALVFPSAFVTPHAANNTVPCRYFPASRAGPKPRAATAGRAFPRRALLARPPSHRDCP